MEKNNIGLELSEMLDQEEFETNQALADAGALEDEIGEDGYNHEARIFASIKAKHKNGATK